MSKFLLLESLLPLGFGFFDLLLANVLEDLTYFEELAEQSKANFGVSCNLWILLVHLDKGSNVQRDGLLKHLLSLYLVYPFFQQRQCWYFCFFD